MATLFDTLLDRFPYVETESQEATLNAMLTVARRFLDRGIDLTENEAQKWIQYGALLGTDFKDAGAAYQTWATELYNAAQRGQRLPSSGAALASSSIFWDAQTRRIYREVLGREPSDQELAEAVNMLSRGSKSLLDVAADLQASIPIFAKTSVMQSVDDFTQQAENAALDVQASIIEAERVAVLEAGAFNADQDFLAMQAKRDAERLALEAQQAASQSSLSVRQAEAAQAYAIEVRADVVDMYRQILKRSPEPFEIDYWSELVTSGQIEDELIAVRLSQSDEALILGAYEQNVYRVPSLDERRHWCDLVQQGLPIDQALDYIANSEEAKQYHAAVVPTPGASPLIVQTINPATGSAQAIDPIMGTSTWGTSYTNQDMIAADPQASPVVELQDYYSPGVVISDLEPVSPIGDTSPALAFKARDEIYKAYTTSLKREPSEADYQYWEPLLASKQLSLSDFKRYVAESEEAKALVKRANDASLTDGAPPEVVADLTKKSEGVGAAVGLLSALAFFLGQ